MPVDMNEWKEGPYIGQGATIYVGSDSYPYTVIDISDQTVTFDAVVPDSGYRDPATRQTLYKHERVTWPKWILVTPDDYKVVDDGKEHDYGDTRDYTYKSNYNVSRAEKYILHKDTTKYRAASRKFNPDTNSYEEGNTTTQKNQAIFIGYRRYYQDPSF